MNSRFACPVSNAEKRCMWVPLFPDWMNARSISYKQACTRNSDAILQNPANQKGSTLIKFLCELEISLHSKGHWIHASKWISRTLSSEFCSDIVSLEWMARKNNLSWITGQMVTAICVLCEAGDTKALMERSVLASAEKRKKGSTRKYVEAIKNFDYQNFTKIIPNFWK